MISFTKPKDFYESNFQDKYIYMFSHFQTQPHKSYSWFMFSILDSSFVQNDFICQTVGSTSTPLLDGSLGCVCEAVPRWPGWPAMAWPTIAWSEWCKWSCLLTWSNGAELDCGCVCLACIDGYSNLRPECGDNTTSFHLLSLPKSHLSLLFLSLP
jgi:hypothetical protein